MINPRVEITLKELEREFRELPVSEHWTWTEERLRVAMTGREKLAVAVREIEASMKRLSAAEQDRT